MKPILKIASLALFSALLFLFACKKKEDTTNPTTNPTTYASMADFYAANGVKSETHSINATSGGTFTTAKGTKVTIAPNALTDTLGNPITGTVTVEFKDIYKKSDMLLSDMPTTMSNGRPLKSGGEFFININADGKSAVPAPGNPIVIEQPLNQVAGDTGMRGFLWGKNVAGNVGWNAIKDTMKGNTVELTASSYIFSLYQFSFPAGKGTWCNSDNPDYFSTYPQTTLTINPAVNPADYSMDVFLVFKNISSMVHVYKDANSKFPYLYAPQGLQCTVVAIGAKDGKLYASYTDITISANQTINVSLAETTDTDLKAKLATLN